MANTNVLTEVFQRSAFQPIADVNEERETILAAQDGDQAAKERLILAYAPALRNGVGTATRTRMKSVSPDELEDLRQRALLGLLEAIQAWNPATHERLAAIAEPHITHHVTSHSVMGAAFTVPPRTASRFFGILREAEGNIYVAMRLAPQRHMERETFLAVLEAFRGVESLDDPTGNRSDSYTANGGGFAEGDGWSRASADPVAAKAFADVEDAMLAKIAISGLDETEERIIRMAYAFDGDPLPDAEIAHRMGLSRQKVQRVRAAALEKMRRALGVLPTPDAGDGKVSA